MPSSPSLVAQQAAQEAHFIRRVRERFGLKLSAARYRYWIAKVEQVLPGTVLLYKCEHYTERTAWKIRAGGFTLRVIYDERTQRLVTALPYGRDETATLGHRQLLRLRAKSKIDRDYQAKQRRLKSAK